MSSTLNRPGRSTLLLTIILLNIMAMRTTLAEDHALDAPGNFNPIVPGYFADPTIERFGDLFYLYATTDGNGGGRGPATVWVSRDLVDWVLVPMNWPTTPVYWAPDVQQGPDGRFYLYFNQPCNTFAGVSDSPIGPWTPLTSNNGLVIPDRLVKDVITLDTQLFEDTDGTVYGYWGTWGIFANSGCGFGVFNPDMKSFARLGMIPNTQAKDFFEAPFMIERNGVYYLTYSSGSCHDASYRVQYAVSDRPDGEFTMGPNNPILASSEDGTVHGPGHHSILEYGDEYYIVYHRHDIPVTPNGMHRQVCVDRLVFEQDGVIQRVTPTHRGVGALASGPRQRNLALNAKVTASSFYQDTLRGHTYKPEYAVDDNHATLWRPAENRPGHWLCVDLGRVQPVRRTHLQFEYATWYTQYLIEASMDGRTWQVFADRRDNTRWGSPMVDDGAVQARYLRITVTGTELPGLFGALWNVKVFDQAPQDPLLAMADEAFERWGTARRRGSAPPQETGKGAPGSAPPALLVHLDVADLALGTAVTAWANQGDLGGALRSGRSSPMVGMATGCKAVRFSGQQILTASFPAPRSLAGNSAFTVAAWVNNPEVGESECLVSWAGRGGPDATTAQFGYGTHPEFGAAGHWGFADMGFGGPAPQAGQWHHLAVVFDGVVERVYVDGRQVNAEAKMLLMHAGRPMYVGASEPGTEFFDGFLASLRIYDGALGETEVRALAKDRPSADVLVHLDAAKLDYGPLTSWANHGSLGGQFTRAGRSPEVDTVNQRMAVCLDGDQSLVLTPDTEVALNEFTLLVTLVNPAAETGECVVTLVRPDGRRIAALPVPAGPTWQQAALVCRGSDCTVFGQGQAVSSQTLSGLDRIKAIELGGRAGFTGALSRVQLFGRALTTAELQRMHDLWKSEWHTPRPDPAAFVQVPRALNTTTIAMAAQPGRSDFGAVEYLFAETTGHAGADSSAWTSSAFFLDDGLEPDTDYAYTVTLRDALGNLSAPSAVQKVTTGTGLFKTVSDRFEGSHDFLAQGTAGTVWDGCLGREQGSLPEAVVVRDGALRLQSSGTVWDGGKPLGPFVFKRVSGDFVVQVKVTDYAGLAARRVPGNNDGGLMVRVPDMSEAGPGEDLVQLNFFPIWNQGNMVTTLDGGRTQTGNMLAWDAHRHLQIIRQGTLFHFRASADGKHWQTMPGSPVERRDMTGLSLQVGLYHASYGSDTSHISFSDFQLTTRP